MFSLMQITAFILLWCFLSALLSLYICFFYPKRLLIAAFGGYVSSLWIAPLVIGGAAFFFRQSLIFPSFLSSSLFERLCYAAVPGILLFISSGWFSELVHMVFEQRKFWSNKPFFLVAVSLGKDPMQQIKKVVLIKSFLESFHRILPIFVGELFLVEVLFNANGVCFDFWLKIKARDIYSSLLYLAILSAGYFALHSALLGFKSFIGRRLEGYT